MGSFYIVVNISMEYFIGLIGVVVIYGICVVIGEWSIVIVFIFLIWLFIFYFLIFKVFMVLEFLEKCFNRYMWLIFVMVFILVNVFVFMGFVIYGGSLILIEFFGMNVILVCVLIGIIIGGWVIWGGLKLVVFMDVLMILIMIIGGLSVIYLGLLYLGGGNGLLVGF